MLVHKSRIAKDAKIFALQQVRNYVGSHVFPCHRLDRKTSGVLLFAKSEDANRLVQKQFKEAKVQKTYQAIVRGYISLDGIIDYALTNEGKTNSAVTHFRRLATYEFPLANDKYLTSRYSLVELQPKTGRFHQLRKHLAHIRHPILGDRPHGCNKQNRLWKHTFGMITMMLHAECLRLEWDGELIDIRAKQSEVFNEVLGMLEGGD